MKVVVDFDLCESNAVCMNGRPGGLRGEGRRLPLRPERQSRARSCTTRSGRRPSAAPSRRSRSRTSERPPPDARQGSSGEGRRHRRRVAGRHPGGPGASGGQEFDGRPGDGRGRAPLSRTTGRPLSKEYLTADEVDEDRLRLRPTADPEALGLDWRLGRAATVALDTEAPHRDPRRRGGHRLRRPGRGLRSPAPAPPRSGGCSWPAAMAARAGPAACSSCGRSTTPGALRAALDAGARSMVLVCGAGFIGAEVAASARTRGARRSR